MPKKKIDRPSILDGLKSSNSRHTSVRMRHSVHTSMRLSPAVARELEIYSMVGRFQESGPGSQRGIIEEALVEWFMRHPLDKEDRIAAERLAVGKGGVS